MNARYWRIIYGLAAAIFAVAAALRLLSVTDTLAFAYLSMAAGLTLVTLRRPKGDWGLLRFVPEIFLFVALWLFVLHYLGW